jgi:hypothetical protein
MAARSKLILGFVLVVAILAGVGVYFAGRLSPSLASALEAYGERATGTDVRVEAVDVSLPRARARVSGLVVGNPPGYDSEYSLRIDDIDVDVDAASLARNPLVLKDVTLRQAMLNAEQRGGSSNLTEILDHMDRAGGEPEGSEPSRKVIIDRFRLLGGRITLTSDALSEPESLELPDVVVEDVGRAQGGLTFGEATDALLAPVLQAARTAVRERLSSAAGEAVKRKVEEAARERLRQLTEPQR